jgi:hypothetical protein
VLRRHDGRVEHEERRKLGREEDVPFGRRNLLFRQAVTASTPFAPGRAEAGCACL